MGLDTFDEQVGCIAAMDNALSRQAYRLVVQHGWLGKDAAAEAMGVARSVAAFHLDKLVAAGLLVTRFARPEGRSGPGAGRPAKLYGRSDLEVDLSLPPRRYDLAGTLLAEAVSRSAASGESVIDLVGPVAREAGELASGGAKPRSAAARRAAVVELLEDRGYEPIVQGRDVVLRNCPFHALAEQHRHLVCGMNHAYLSGVLEGVGASSSMTARLAPEPGLCCVRLGPA